MKRTLLEKARKDRVKAIMMGRRAKYPEKELRELAVAWLTGEVGNHALMSALGRKQHAHNSSITTVMLALRRGVMEGAIKIKS